MTGIKIQRRSRQLSFDPVKANPLVLLTRHKTSSKEHGALRGGVSLFANSGQPFPLHSLLAEKLTGIAYTDNYLLRHNRNSY